MKQGQLVEIHHLCHWHGTEASGAVLATVGRVGVLDGQGGDGRWSVIFPDAVYIYQAKELEPVKVGGKPVWEEV